MKDFSSFFFVWSVPRFVPADSTIQQERTVLFAARLPEEKMISYSTRSKEEEYIEEPTRKHSKDSFHKLVLLWSMCHTDTAVGFSRL